MNIRINILKSPSRTTSHTKSLIDVIIVNNTNDEMFTEILGLGYSDHLARFLYIESKNLVKDPKTTCNRHFRDNNFYCCTVHFDSVKILFSNKCTLY